jgi:hypothetical protein
MNKHARKIDLVYMWVNGEDPKWLARKNNFLGVKVSDDEDNSNARYADNGELKYSLRSVEKNVPWINRIFIVTDNQVPDWLNRANPRVLIVDHKEILPEKALPCYNSSVIECFLWRIPGLSEYFLLANDDTFVNKPLVPDFFFADDMFPIVRLKRKPFGVMRYRIKKWISKKSGTYRSMLVHSAMRISVLCGKYYSGVPHHNIDAYRKSDYEKVIKLFEEEVDSSLSHHTRHKEDFHRSTISYYVLAVKRAYLRYVGRRESCRIRLHKPDFMRFITKYNPSLFCLNDTQHATNADRERARPFLEILFPEKSTFEASETTTGNDGKRTLSRYRIPDPN